MCNIGPTKIARFLHIYRWTVAPPDLRRCWAEARDVRAEDYSHTTPPCLRRTARVRRHVTLAE
jgi:hypothetical protein